MTMLGRTQVPQLRGGGGGGGGGGGVHGIFRRGGGGVAKEDPSNEAGSTGDEGAEPEAPDGDQQHLCSGWVGKVGNVGEWVSRV